MLPVLTNMCQVLTVSFPVYEPLRIKYLIWRRNDTGGLVEYLFTDMGPVLTVSSKFNETNIDFHSEEKCYWRL